MFALHIINPKLGRIVATHIDYQRDGKVKTDIPMVDCRELLPDFNNEQEGYINVATKFNPYITTYRYRPDFVCPQTDSMTI